MCDAGLAVTRRGRLIEITNISSPPDVREFIELQEDREEITLEMQFERVEPEGQLMAGEGPGYPRPPRRVALTLEWMEEDDG